MAEPYRTFDRAVTTAVLHQAHGGDRPRCPGDTLRRLPQTAVPPFAPLPQTVTFLCAVCGWTVACPEPL